MKQKDIKLILEMLDVQRVYDNKVFEVHNVNKFTEDMINMATLDEVGELVHELKANWCWWKFTQEPVEIEKVLEELIDIWHFVLSYDNHFSSLHLENTKECFECVNNLIERHREMIRKYGLHYALCIIPQTGPSRMCYLIAASESLGFTMQQVYEAYLKKNAINYQRLEEGY